MSQYQRVDGLLRFIIIHGLLYLLLIHQSTLIFLVRGGCLWTIHVSKASGNHSLIYYLEKWKCWIENTDEEHKLYNE